MLGLAALLLLLPLSGALLGAARGPALTGECPCGGSGGGLVAAVAAVAALSAPGSRLAVATLLAATAAATEDPEEDLDDRLIAHYSLNESAGTDFIVDGAQGVTAKLLGFHEDADPWRPLAPLALSVLRLSGGPGCVIAPRFPQPAGELSGAVWVRADGPPAPWATIVANWAHRPGAFFLGLHGTTGDLQFRVRQADGTQVSVREGSVRPLPLGVWHHVVFVADGRRLSLYRNGAQVGTSASYDGTLIQEPDVRTLGIGVKPSDAGFSPDALFPGHWRGELGDVRLWARGLAPAEARGSGVRGARCTAFAAPGDWWAIELCHQAYVRQVHGSEQILLGVFAGASSALDGGGGCVHHYVAGQACGAQRRSATVVFECCDSPEPVITAAEETVVCAYVVTVCAASMCSPSPQDCGPAAIPSGSSSDEPDDESGDEDLRAMLDVERGRSAWLATQLKHVTAARKRVAQRVEPPRPPETEDEDGRCERVLGGWLALCYDRVRAAQPPGLNVELWNCKAGCMIGIGTTLLAMAVGALSVCLSSRAAVPPPEPPDTGDIRASNACQICYTRSLDSVIVGCWHQVMCSLCADKCMALDARCPICREPIAGVQRVYRS